MTPLTRCRRCGLEEWINPRPLFCPRCGGLIVEEFEHRAFAKHRATEKREQKAATIHIHVSGPFPDRLPERGTSSPLQFTPGIKDHRK